MDSIGRVIRWCESNMSVGRVPRLCGQWRDLTPVGLVSNDLLKRSRGCVLNSKISWGCYPFSFLKQNVLLWLCLYYGYCKGEHVDRVDIQSYLLLFYWVYCGVILYGVIGFNDCDLFCCNGLIELLFHYYASYRFWNVMRCYCGWL